MKNSIKVLITVLVSMYSISLMAQQTTGGVYLTQQDYRAHKLSYILTTGDKMKLNGFLNGKNISLTNQGKKIKLAKSEVFGYRLQGQDYRFFQNEAYSIVDTAGFMIYSHQRLTQQVKGYKPETQYFYSVDQQQSVMALTVENLEASFPGQTGFRYSLQSYISKDADLMAYDKVTNQYKVKYLFMQQKQVLASHQL